MIRKVAGMMVKAGVALEKRFHPSQEPPSWYSAFFGGTATSGVSVTDDSAMTLTAVFSAVRILSETLASLPLIVYKRLEKGGKERDYKHPLYRLLHTQPNPEMSAFSFFETSMAWLCLRGNAYAEIERDGAGNPIALWPIPANRVQVERGKTGRLQWRVSLPNGGEAFLFPGEILHVPGLSLNGITGLSPIGYARESIGLGLAAQEFGARLFSSKCIPGGILEHPGKLKDEATVDRLRKQVEEVHSGLSKSHRTLLLEDGMKWHQTAISPEDSQFLETRKFQVTEIARFYRIPPHMMGDLDRATFSNIEQQSIDFVVNTMRSWIVRWEQAIQRTLFFKDEQATYFTEFLVDGLLRGDIQSRYAAHALGIQNGFLSPDQVREMENMNPREDGKGGEFLRPLNMQSASTDQKKTAA